MAKEYTSEELTGVALEAFINSPSFKRAGSV